MKKLCRQMLTVTALGIAGLMFTAQRAAWAGDDEIAPSFTPQQREEIKNLVTSQIAAHPEIVVEALKQMENLKQQQHRALVEQVGRQLRDPQRSPSLGKPDSKHYVMEFFDFNCGYCKYMEPFMKEVSEDPKLDVQVVYVNYPVLAESSQKAAVLGLALYQMKPESYLKFHRVLMNGEHEIDKEETLRKLVAECGMDYEAVVDYIRGEKPVKQLMEYMSLGRSLGIAGTPYFIIDGREYRGAFPSVEALKARITDASAP